MEHTIYQSKDGEMVVVVETSFNTPNARVHICHKLSGGGA